MARRILYAWELGGGAGHVMRMRPIAEALRAGGASVTVAARDGASAAPLAAAGFDVVQAPRITHGLNRTLRAFNYAEVLVRAGYDQSENILSLVSQWRDLIASRLIDLVIADFAPGALLGARVANVCAATVGTGFALPPHGSPLPSIRPTQTPGPHHPHGLEEKVFQGIGDVLKRYRAPDAPDLASLFNTGHDELCVFRELDHCGPREREVRYAGPVFSGPPQTSLKAASRAIDVFAYLDGSSSRFEALIKGIAGQPGNGLAVVRGRPAFDLKKLIAPYLGLSGDPVALQEVLPSAQVVVCHGGMGLVSQALLAGVPLVVAPENPEQGGTAHRIAALGAAEVVPDRSDAATVSNLVQFVRTNRRYAESARSFAQRYRSYTVVDTVNGIAERLLNLT